MSGTLFPLLSSQQGGVRHRTTLILKENSQSFNGYLYMIIVSCNVTYEPLNDWTTQETCTAVLHGLKCLDMKKHVKNTQSLSYFWTYLCGSADSLFFHYFSSFGGSTSKKLRMGEGHICRRSAGSFGSYNAASIHIKNLGLC